MFRWEGCKKLFSHEFRMLIENGELDKVISMVGVTPLEYLTDSTGTTLLHLAARCDNKVIIDHLITNSNWKVDVRDSSGASPLKIAVQYDNYEAVDALLNANANSLLTDDSGECILETVFRKKTSFGVFAQEKTEFWMYLFLKKVRENTPNNEKLVQILLRVNCPPSYVIFLNDVNVTRMFWKQKYTYPYSARKDKKSIDSVVEAALTVVDGPHFDFLFKHYDFYFIFKAETFYWLLNVVLNRSAYEEIQYAIYKRSRIVELFEIFTKKVIEFNLLNETTSTNELSNLSQIFRRADNDILQAFFDSGTVEHVKSKIGYDLRSNLFVNQHPKIREMTQIMTGYDVNSRNHLGQTALHIAVGANLPEVVEKLLYAGADPDAVDRNGKTPAFYLFYTTTPLTKTRNCLVFLLRSGANVQICDNYVISKLAILTVMGVPVKQSILDIVNSNIVARGHYDNCRRELHEMTEKKIFRSVTIFTLLSQRPAKIARFVSGQIEEINKALEDLVDFTRKERPYYYPILNWNIKEALRISKLRDSAALVIEMNIEQLKGFTLVIDKIVEFLNLQDLLLLE